MAVCWPSVCDLEIFTTLSESDCSKVCVRPCDGKLSLKVKVLVQSRGSHSRKLLSFILVWLSHSCTLLLHAVLTHLKCVCLSGDEIGMLEDMEVGVSDLKGVAFTITEAKTEQPDDLLPTLSGTWWEYTHTHLYTQWVCSFLTLCVHLQLGAVLLLKCRCPRRPSAHFHRN